MTMDRGSGSTSARATSGRRISLRLGVLLIITAVLAPLLGVGVAQASMVESSWYDGSRFDNPTGFPYQGAAFPDVRVGGNPDGSGVIAACLTTAPTASILGAVATGPEQACQLGGGSGINGNWYWTSCGIDSVTPAGTWGCQLPGSSAAGWPIPWFVAYASGGVMDGKVVAVWDGTALDIPAPEPCDDGVITDQEDFGGWGGGGAWGSGSDGSGPIPENLKAWYWDPIAKAWTAWNGQYAELDAQIEEWVTLGYYEDGGGSAGDLDGFGGYGGGGSWGGSWTVACDANADDVPDGFIAPEPTDGPMWEPLYPEGAVPVTAPPQDAPVPTGSCDFGVLDPSSWLCGLAGLFGNLLDAIRWIIGWLGRLAGWLLDLFVPDLQTLQDSFADVDTAWDASGPGQLTGGVTAIAAPVLSMDENMPTTCEGPQFTLPLPQSRSFTMNPLSTCGELTQYILGVVYPLETALIYLGGFFLGLRIVTRPFGMETPGTTQAAAA